MTTYQQFYNKWKDKGVDIDGFYGWQCWDGVAQYAKELGFTLPNCNITGYVQDIYTQYQRNGLLNHTTPVTSLQAGDIVIFKISPSTPASHIAIFHSDAGGGQGWFFGQNQGGTYRHSSGGSSFNLTKLPYSATYTYAFRPKKFTTTVVENKTVVNSAKLKDEKAKFTVTVDKLNVRATPSTSGQVVATYTKGQSFHYDSVYHGDGYLWLSYVSTSGHRRYVACRTYKNGQRGQLYGTFS